MADVFLIPDGESISHLNIKNSRFISQCFPVQSEKEVKSIISSLWKEHPEARHIVYAFILGSPKSKILGMSDDGEPKGTAGRPILQVLNGSGIYNILCTVIRYFGGTLLGTGGLVKAYGQGSKDAVMALKTKEFKEEINFNFSISYNQYDTIKYFLKKNNVEILNEVFKDLITVFCKTEKNNYDTIEKYLINLNYGKNIIIK